MATTQSAKRGLILLLALFMVAQTAESMDLVLTNNMNQDAGVTCGFEGRVGDFGSRNLPQGQTYVFPVGTGGGDFSGLRYSCSVATAGKPNAVVEVFAGTGGAGNTPCQCAGAVCSWSINLGGISCGGFTHPWNF